MRATVRVLALVVTVMLGLAACGDATKSSSSSAPDSDGTPTVATVNYPLAYFAERIGGGAVEVVFPAPADEDPAYWEPDDAALAIYQAADRILLNGATYAKWIPKVSLAPSKLVDTSASAKNRYISIEGTTTHAHGPDGEHAHAGIAFTTWLDLGIAMQQADAVRDALVSLVPEKAEAFEANTVALRDDLEALDTEIRDIVRRDPTRRLVVSHPVYQYFSRAYDLNTRAVHWEPDAKPDEAAWSAFKDLRRTFPATWMLWEGEPIPASVQALKDEGVASQVFAPCGNRPPTGDFLSTMRENVKNLGEVFAK